MAQLSPHFSPGKRLLPLLGAGILALLVRLVCFPGVSNDFTAFLSHWVTFFRENGGFGAFSQTVGDYNVPYLYYLAAISYLPGGEMYLIKLFSVGFDYLMALGAMALVETFGGSGRRQVLAFSFTLLLPTVVLNSAYWGQCDSVFTCFLLWSLVLFFRNRPAAGMVCAGVAFAFKLQAVFLLPVLLLFLLVGKFKWRHVLLFPAAFFALCLPAVLLGKPFSQLFTVYLNQAGSYHHSLTLNAPSLYALLPSTDPFPGAAPAGILLAALLVLAVSLRGFLVSAGRGRGGLTDRALLMAAVFFTVGIPLFLPYMHDRYFYIADVLTLCYALCLPRRTLCCAGTQLASLGVYLAYLKIPGLLNPHYLWNKKVGAVLLLLVFLTLARDFWRETKGESLSASYKT